MQIRQNWIQEDLENIRDDYNLRNNDEAFQALAISVIFDVDYEDIKPEEVVDGGQDKQIDVIRIEDDEERSYASIHIIQAKNTSGFSSNTLIQMRNGLDWIFGKRKDEVEELENDKLKSKIMEIRDIRKRYYSSNMSLTVYYVTNGDSSNLSNEYVQERKTITDLYGGLGFDNFNFREIGAYELYELVNANQSRQRHVDVEVPIVYDVNRNSLIEYVSKDSKALICTITGQALADLASGDPRDAIFDMNVRPFYGDRGKVNADIKMSCISDDSPKFWFLNNGVTMTCDRYELNRDPDSPMVKVYNAQIVNGCQTTVTIREANERGELKQDVKVLLRIYSTDSTELIEKITLTTNNQNRITDRDLKSNDDVQRTIQHVLHDKYNVYYERKNKEFRSIPAARRSNTIPNTKAAQAYLAVVRRRPSVARGYLARIWSDHYHEIFSNATVDDLLYAYKIYTYALKRGAQLARLDTASKELKQNVVYGAFHIARVMGYLLRDDKWGRKFSEEITLSNARLINEDATDDQEFLIAYQASVEMVSHIRSLMTDSPSSPALFFKNTAIERQIESYVTKHKNKKAGEDSRD